MSNFLPRKYDILSFQLFFAAARLVQAGSAVCVLTDHGCKARTRIRVASYAILPGTALRLEARSNARNMARTSDCFVDLKVSRRSSRTIGKSKVTLKVRPAWQKEYLKPFHYPKYAYSQPTRVTTTFSYQHLFANP